VTVLKRESDIYPANLLETIAPWDQWWVIYTLSRHEKQLMRKLRASAVRHYGPQFIKRTQSPRGRIRSTQQPLFPNYVFLTGDEHARLLALQTNCVSRIVPVVDVEQLVTDLRQLRDLIATGAPITPEEKLVPGDRVRVRSGPFKDFEGTVIQREGQRRLIIAVNFTSQGASVRLDECQLENIG
jgi:transcription antitermination factor NusG